MVLTASAPFHRGFITDVDARWNILCHTQDCRTPEEKGLRPLNKNKFVINKSRHDSIDCYISPEGKKFNDLEILFYEEDYKTLVDNGIDDLLAQHVAHLFIRDTISVFKEKIHQDDEEEIGHFEVNIRCLNLFFIILNNKDFQSHYMFYAYNLVRITVTTRFSQIYDYGIRIKININIHFPHF